MQRIYGRWYSTSAQHSPLFLLQVWLNTKAEKIMPVHLLPSQRVTWLLLISWLIHIFPQSTVNPSQPKKASQENIHKKGIPYTKDTLFLLHPALLLFLGLQQEWRGQGEEEVAKESVSASGNPQGLSFFCRRGYLKPRFSFSIPKFICLWYNKTYLQHFCNLSSTLLSSTPSCLLLPADEIQFANTSDFLNGEVNWSTDYYYLLTEFSLACFVQGSLPVLKEMPSVLKETSLQFILELGDFRTFSKADPFPRDVKWKTEPVERWGMGLQGKTFFPSSRSLRTIKYGS